MSICTDTYGWSKEFDITTVGIAGSIQLHKAKIVYDHEILDESLIEFESEKIDLGVLISSLDFPYYETKVITIIPRYVIVNATHRPIIISQDSKISHK